MGINEDSFGVLLLFYEAYSNGKNEPSIAEIAKETGWEENRIRRALIHLIDLGYVNGKRTLGNRDGVPNFVHNGITEKGINLIEEGKTDPNKIKIEFNISLDIDQIKLSLIDKASLFSII